MTRQEYEHLQKLQEDAMVLLTEASGKAAEAEEIVKRCDHHIDGVSCVVRNTMEVGGVTFQSRSSSCKICGQVS